MSNPVRRVPRRRSERNPKNVIFETTEGKKVRAPRPGKIYRRDFGLVVITRQGHRHRLRGVEPRPELVGKVVRDGRWIGNATGERVVYKRWSKDGEQWAAMPVVKKPLVVPPPKAVKPWTGLRTVSAGWTYSSGAGHYAWDIVMPIGTPLVSPIHGVVVQVNDGVPNNRTGSTPGSGSPSNFVYIHGLDVDGHRVSVYLQHLNRGLKVKQGQRVRPGTLVGHSGNSGNSTGPHLHVHAMRGWISNRYALYGNSDLAIYRPSSVWS